MQASPRLGVSTTYYPMMDTMQYSSIVDIFLVCQAQGNIQSITPIARHDAIVSIVCPG